MAINAIAEDYFRSMNPLAAKIHEDIEEAKNSYENIWDSLTDKEKVRSQHQPHVLQSQNYANLKITFPVSC